MTMRGITLIALCCAALLLACGDKKNSGTGNTSGISDDMLKSSCHAQCDAQEKVEGCEPFVSLADCKTLCDGLVQGLNDGCEDEFKAYYDCSASDGFKCAGTLVTSNSSACQPNLDALNACSNGDGAAGMGGGEAGTGGGVNAGCEGADDNGRCQPVTCQCDDGPQQISGTDNSGGTCKCVDEVTCKDLCF